MANCDALRARRMLMRMTSPVQARSCRTLVAFFVGVRSKQNTFYFCRTVKNTFAHVMPYIVAHLLLVDIVQRRQVSFSQHRNNSKCYHCSRNWRPSLAIRHTARWSFGTSTSTKLATRAIQHGAKWLGAWEREGGVSSIPTLRDYGRASCTLSTTNTIKSILRCIGVICLSAE